MEGAEAVANDINDVINKVRMSRRYFLKHLHGVRNEQWDWKPSPQCKSIREILAHMVANDRLFMETLNADSPMEHGSVEERDIAKLLEMLNKSHESLCAFLRLRHANTPLDTEIPFFGRTEKLETAMSRISFEDYYHAGQIALIRMATDPSWENCVSVHDGDD